MEESGDRRRSVLRPVDARLALALLATVGWGAKAAYDRGDYSRDLSNQLTSTRTELAYAREHCAERESDRLEQDLRDLRDQIKGSRP